MLDLDFRLLSDRLLSLRVRPTVIDLMPTKKSRAPACGHGPHQGNRTTSDCSILRHSRLVVTPIIQSATSRRRKHDHFGTRIWPGSRQTLLILRYQGRSMIDVENKRRFAVFLSHCFWLARLYKRSGHDACLWVYLQPKKTPSLTDAAFYSIF
jgi:hypothetical protein